MTPEEIKKKILEYKWEHWADRPFGAFMLSQFRGGSRREGMQKFGVGAEWPAMLFQKGVWYRSEEIWDLFVVELQRYLDQGNTFFEVVRKCEAYRTEGIEKISKLIESKDTPVAKLSALYEVLTLLKAHVWFAHGFEHLYIKQLRAEIPKYLQGDLEKIMGDICYPTKKNVHNYFEEALRSSVPIEEVERTFAWVKVRDGFSDPFSIDELQDERKRLQAEKPKEEFKRPHIPDELKTLAAVAQELVYYRTLRTDVLYELMYLARPILQEVATHFNLPFKDLRDYSIHDLLEGKIEKYEYGNVSLISFGAYSALLHGPVADLEIKNSTKELKGAIAFKGRIQGRAKVVMTAHDIDKVQEGDILIAPTTAPSYILGMQKAAAFVTDEGGITSHASIVAREMKKPCIIGTKTATRVFHDGDLIEVDAEKGIVRKI
ncbi:MAG: hypothetical protein A2664_03645 [Candidatus Taylorbacteria bacterium RIFCSPHIGHO2_01_FULL_46_22b]|uniref:PEP-utilising enzyme mobile domain-containing protein n=1 Tax=Candidatus Taylorbacteria bacterium RIFCSPHIGHO2_01_FULL_46_22b TaxID=1802301 RepID=A0A1G2M1P4_9BACT|nr:MAG: hypothetical protein A2664_03645 [Candidatus Taylorbacteria bacterium RIFCSPHIGHO2_01_FULL_46_22b]